MGSNKVRMAYIEGWSQIDRYMVFGTGSGPQNVGTPQNAGF